MTAEPDRKSQIEDRRLPAAERSGQDLDIWGGEPTRMSYVPDPNDPESECLCKDKDGRCPEGCLECYVHQGLA